ncbi:MAG: hypothetical protein V1899_10505 [Planctomycetota bacterium]
MASKVKPATGNVRGAILSVMASQNLIPANTPDILDIALVKEPFRFQVLYVLRLYGLFGSGLFGEQVAVQSVWATEDTEKISKILSKVAL